MEISTDSDSPCHFPPFQIDSSGTLTKQVVNHVSQILASGLIGPGGRLPSERTVALDFKISRNTVTAAYDELQQCGLIRRIRGKGSFRCNPQTNGESFCWSGKISSTAHLLDEPVLELLARSCASTVPHPLSAGTPSLDCFPTEQFRESINKIITNDFPQALAVAATEGQTKLRRSIARSMNVEPNRVMITSGGQTAIDLVARCLIEPGNYAIVESPTYPGAIQCLRAAGARLVDWNTDWKIDDLEELVLRYRPKLIFTTPTFQNPTGKVMPLDTRKRLLALALRYHLPVIEDDVYSKTYLNGKPGPESLLKLDTHSLVIHLSTFSKMLAPGLRVGWMVAPLYMVKQLSLIKMRASLFTGGLNQLSLSDMIDSGTFSRHLENLRRHHCILRNTAVDALQPAVQDGLLSFDVPEGSLYLWCKLATGFDLESLLGIAEERGVSLAPGHAFFPGEAPAPYFRLCYTATTQVRLRQGVEIVTGAIRQAAKSLSHR